MTSRGAHYQKALNNLSHTSRHTLRMVNKDVTELEAVTAERDRLLAFIERGWDTHMRFGVIQEDGSTEMLPCAAWCYACKLDRLARAEARLGRIAGAHEKNVGSGGMTDGACIECGEPYPCPTYVWATTDRDALATWDPADDDEDRAEHHVVDGVKYLCHTNDHYCPEGARMPRCCEDSRCKGCRRLCDDGTHEHQDVFGEGLEVKVCTACGRESPNLGAGETRVGP